MTCRIAAIVRAVRKVCRDRRGITAVLVGVSMPVIIGFASMGVDYGLMIAAQRAMQANVNAAALAGAQTWSAPGGTSGAGQTTAQNWYKTYPVKDVTITSVTATPVCIPQSTNSTLPACNASSPNVLRVSETGTIPTYMWRLFGIDSITVSVNSAASRSGGGSPPLNVIFVLDATYSMATQTDDTGCTVPGYPSPTKFQCALYGVQTAMKQLIAAQDNVGILVFPGNAGSSGNQTWTPPCSGSYTTAVPYYSPNIAYQIANTSGATNAALDNLYSAGSGALNDNDPLVRAVGDFAASPAQAACLQAKGGEGTYYAEILTAATNILMAQTNGYQNVIVMLSDGGSSARSSNMYSGTWTTHGPKQCNQAVQAAYTAANSDNIWVYAIAYDADPATNCPAYTSGSGSSATTTNDTNSVSASTTAGITMGAQWTPCLTMQAIASEPSRFFSTSSGCALSTSPNTYSSVNAAFQQVAGTLGKPRLVMN